MMKKIYETPEFTSVPVAEQDVIRTSPLIYDAEAGVKGSIYNFDDMFSDS